MILLSKTATITHNNSTISFDLSDMLPQGVYEILLIVDEKTKKKKKKQPFLFPTTELPINPNLTFSRNELYDDDGR
jgi:hypothetical protein